MEWQAIHDHMETEQVLSAKPTQVTVETEVALPGGLREEARVYYADAAVAVNGGELSGSRVSTDGRVTFHALYAQGDLSRVAALETSADFTQTLPLKEENAQAAAVRLQPRAEVQHVSAKAFNGRLLLRAIVNLTAEAALPRSVAFVKDIAGDVEKKTQELTIQRTVGEGEGQILLREEFELSDVLQVKDTLYATGVAQVEDILGGADGKATITGTIQLEAYHTSDMPGRPLIYTRHAMPYEQAINLSGAMGDAMTARSVVKDVAVLCQDNGESGKVMRAEVQLYTEVTAVADEKTAVLQDVFTTSGDAVEINTQRVIYRCGTVNEQAAESGKTVMQLPEGSPRIKTALLGFVRPVPVQSQRQKDKLVVEGVLETAVVYLTDESAIPISVEQEEPFRAVFTTQADSEDSLSLTAVQVEPSAITGDRVELKYILRLSAEGVRKVGADIIADAAAADAPETEKGVALYFLQPGESVWDLAKRYRMSVREILDMNPKLKETAAPGTPVVTYRR